MSQRFEMKMRLVSLNTEHDPTWEAKLIANPGPLPGTRGMGVSGGYEAEIVFSGHKNSDFFKFFGHPDLLGKDVNFELVKPEVMTI